MIHKAVAQTMIWSMQNLSLAELTINFNNTTGMSAVRSAGRMAQIGPAPAIL